MILTRTDKFMQTQQCQENPYPIMFGWRGSECLPSSPIVHKTKLKLGLNSMREQLRGLQPEEFCKKLRRSLTGELQKVWTQTRRRRCTQCWPRRSLSKLLQPLSVSLLRKNCWVNWTPPFLGLSRSLWCAEYAAMVTLLIPV